MALDLLESLVERLDLLRDRESFQVRSSRLARLVGPFDDRDAYEYN